MTYIDDLAQSNQIAREVFNASLDGIDLVAHEVATKMFPNVKLQESINLCYFPFKLCHSLPTVNQRGRAFTPRVLANSFASLNDQLIDMDHQLEANGIGFDRIIGHIKATKFDLPKDFKDQEIASISQPFAVEALGALFLRAKGVQDAIDSHLKKKEKWSVSMECGHFWKDAYFLYRGALIPLEGSEVAMRDCVKSDAVSQYSGYPLAVCLGGLDKNVDFWGAALTTSPADKTADILSFIGGNSKDLASKKIFYMPLQKFSQSELEVANSSADKKMDEIANITILGETEPAADGHSHFILSNLQIFPTADHTHHLSSYNISRGSNPLLTGVTEAHRAYGDSSSGNGHSGNDRTHMHLVSIPLKGKYKENTSADKDNESDPLALLSEEANMKLEEFFAKLDFAIANMAKATTPEQKSQAELEVANVRKEIATIQSKELTEKEKQDHVQQLIKDGKLVTKEVADQSIAEAIKLKEEENQKQQKSLEAKQKRIEKCLEAKVDLDTEYEGITGTDGKPMTFRSKLESIPVDEAGEKIFQMDLLTWAALSKPEEDKEGEEKIAEQQQQLAEAANKKPAKKILALAGGGSTGGSGANKEVANASVPKQFLGKRGIKSLVKS